MKYEDLYQTLKNDILNGKYKVGESIPKTNELISTHKISLSTVNKAVKLLVEDGLINRVKSKGSFVLESGVKNERVFSKSSKIGLIFHGYAGKAFDTHFFRQTFRGIEKECQKFNKHIVAIGREDSTNADLCKRIKEEDLSGLIIYDLFDIELIKDIKELKLPTVLCDYFNMELNLSQISIDHLKAGAISARAMKNRKHSHLHFFGNYLFTKKFNSPNHEYWANIIKAEANLIGIKSVKSSFIPFKGGFEDMKRKVITELNSNKLATGYICASTTYYDILKDIFENNPDFNNKQLDILLFADWYEDKFLFKKKIKQCRWNTMNMGQKAIQVLFDKLHGRDLKPRIYYVDVEIN